MICQNPTWQGISRTPSTNSQNVPRQVVGNCRARSPIRRWKHQQGSPSSECAVEHPSARPACLAWCKSQAPQKGLTSSSWPLSPFLFHSCQGLSTSTVTKARQREVDGNTRNLQRKQHVRISVCKQSHHHPFLCRVFLCRGNLPVADTQNPGHHPDPSVLHLQLEGLSAVTDPLAC